MKKWIFFAKQEKMSECQFSHPTKYSSINHSDGKNETNLSPSNKKRTGKNHIMNADDKSTKSKSKCYSNTENANEEK